MPKRFVDTLFVREGRYSLGEDIEDRGYFLSIPVANRMVDYEEYYRIGKEQYEQFQAEPAVALQFADACREREHDDLLILAPGSDRGDPV